MIRKFRALAAFMIAIALLLSCVPMASAATTDLTYKEYLALSTEEQIAFRNQFSSAAEFKKWYLAAKQSYEDSQNDIIIGDGNSVDLGEILNPTLSSGTCGDNLSWSLSKEGILTITGTGSIYDYAASSAPWYDYASNILIVELPTKLTSIGKNAFAACSEITDVYYANTAANWADVSVSDGNSNLTNATIHYTDAILTQIAVKALPAKIVYEIGETLDAAGLIITLMYNDGTSEDIATGFQLSELDSATVGTKTVTVSYQNQTTTFDVTVTATPTGISILTPPSKVNYWVGEDLDTTGLSLNVSYSDNSTGAIYSGFETSGFDSATPGTKTVTVTYQGFTTTFEVEVSKITATAITILTPPSKNTYWVGADLDTSGLSLEVTFSNGSTDTIDSGIETAGFDSTTEGTKTVTVIYQGLTATFEVIVSNDGRCGDTLSWVIDEDGVLSISGSGRMYDYTYGSAPWYNETVTDIVLDPELTYIGNYAFANMECLTDIVISDSVTVGEGAFSYCRNLTAISVSDNHPDYYTDAQGALYTKDKATLIQVPGAFSGPFTVPNSVEAIANSAFAGCAKLTVVRFTGSSTASGGFTERDGAYTASNSNTTEFGVSNIAQIGDYAFSNCALLTSIDLPANITAIGEGTFQNCSKLTSVTIPKGVTSIGQAAFVNCSNLTSVVFDGSKSGWNGISVDTGNDALEIPVLYRSELKLSNAAPTLYDNIAMNYKANKTLFDEMGITDPYLVISFNGAKTTLTDYTVSEDGTQYVFTFYNIAPNQMDEILSATLYAAYGSKAYEGATLEYSVATYCYRMLGNSSVVNNAAYAELRTLLVDLLHYGAAAQEFTGYTGEKVNERLTETQLAWGTSADPTLENKTVTNYATVANPTATWASVSLVLEDAVTMRFKFTTADIDGLTVKITSDTNTEGWSIESGDFLYEESTGRYYVDFGGLHAGQMRECVYVTVYNGDTAISNTLRYSVESYAYRYANNTSYPTLAALVKAMMRYGDAAYNFAN